MFLDLSEGALYVWSRRIQFKVDIAGVIEIMGSSLYSRLDTPIRELIQNAHDAVMRRRQRELDYQGRIDVLQDSASRTLTFRDDGVGLSPEEAEKYLGTLGIGITGLLKGRGDEQTRSLLAGDGDDLIGQFGIGLFSAFMLAERLLVESRRSDCEEGVRWEAGAGTEITLSAVPRAEVGTSVTLLLKPQFAELAEDEEKLEEAIKQFADFLPVPIYLNDGKARVNVINVAWFEPSPDREAVELELEGYFHETPLDTIAIQSTSPAMQGALYVSPQRTPGFADALTVAVTVRRMVISRHVYDLIPPWAPFLSGVLELQDCSPTASREDLVRDAAFQQVQLALEEKLYQHFELMVEKQPARFEAIVQWHRYTIAGAALLDARLRQMLRTTYRWTTSAGQLTFEEILRRSQADPVRETEADYVIWFNSDRRQERWINELFAEETAPCVHALRSFEESLLASLVADSQDSAVDLRMATPSAEGFAANILGLRETRDAPEEWTRFLDVCRATILCASFDASRPAMAFLNERFELSQTFESLRRNDAIPKGFQRLIDSHFASQPAGRNEIVLNTKHRVVQRAMEQGVSSPLASVVRLLVLNTLHAAGGVLDRDAHRMQDEDLDWIADALWGRDK